MHTAHHSYIKVLAGTALAISLCANAALASAKSGEHFTIDHLMDMRTPKDVQISPGGDWVAYVVEREDEDKDEGRSQIFMTSTDGETTLPLTASYANASTPRWNHDGSKLGFLGMRGEDEDAQSQVWVLDMRGGEAVAYTDVSQGVDDFVFAPNDDRLALVIQDAKPEQDEDDQSPEPYIIDRLQFKADYIGYLDRRRSHIYIQDKPGEGAPRQITFGDYDDEDPVWSPDGKTIAFVSKREDDPDANSNSDIWTVPAAAKRGKYPLTQITTNKGADYSPAWSPDGDEIAYITVLEPEKLWYATSHLAVISARGGNPRLLTENYDRMIFSPEFNIDGDAIIALAEDGGDNVLIRVNAVSGAIKALSPSDHTIADFSLSEDGQMALIKSTHDKPKDVYIMKSTRTKSLTNLNQQVFGNVDLADVERLKVPGWEGNLVESFIYYPPNYKPGKAYPTIFHLHGGPVSQHDSSFDEWAQLYAANGYIAVLPNPHGSSGYGHDFTYALNRQWGVPDFADVDAIADHLVDAGISDPDKLGVGGWSYGGILTNYVITNTTRFAGAVSGASEVNHRANYGHDIYQHEWEVELGLPWEDIEAWESMNPFNNLGKVTTPTLVIGGQLDWNVPIQNSEQLYQVLRRRGIDTQLVVYPDEYHGIRRPSFIRDRYSRYLGWFDDYVKGNK